MSTHDLASSIRNSLRTIRDYYDETLEPQRNSPSVRLPTEGQRDAKMRYAAPAMKRSPPPVSVDILDARMRAHEDLLHFSRVVLQECVDVNGDAIVTRVDHESIPALCDFLKTWADVLVTTDLDEGARCERIMARHATRLQAIAQPERKDWVAIGRCPVLVPDHDDQLHECGGQVRAYGYDDDAGVAVRRIECVWCERAKPLEWWMSQMLEHPEAKDLVTADELISIVAQQLDVVLTHTQIQKWAERNKIPRSGRDDKGRTLYDHKIVLALVRADDERRARKVSPR